MDSTAGIFRITETGFGIGEPTAGPRIHHMCLAVDDIETAMKSCKERGTRLINATPGRSTHGRKVDFIHPQAAGGVAVELCEPPKENR